MAWTSGTATDHNDLLNKLASFLGANGWTIHENVTFQHPNGFAYYNNSYQVDAGINERRLIAEGPGKPGMASSLIAIETAQISTIGAYGWALGAPVSYVPGLSIRNQPGAVPGDGQVMLSLWDSNIPYWFTANEGRVMVLAQVSTRFMFSYIGHGTPFAAPSEAPNPQIVTGNSDHRFLQYADPRLHCLPGLEPESGAVREHLVRNGGEWVEIRQTNYSTKGDPGNYCLKTLPYSGFWAGDDDNGDAYLYPIGVAFNGGLAMLADGLYMTKAAGAAPGSIITVNDIDYVIGINVTQDDRSNRFAMELS